MVIVADDAVQGVSELTRGEDLFEITYLHRTLQALPGPPTNLTSPTAFAAMSAANG
ncbi:hypothetical protein [Ferruginivarius sediminum]|uniref:hypothetical protein n=1 Tax=Ferruginivarius sediminum TaxID=2661937 RepID=UPI00137A40AC